VDTIREAWLRNTLQIWALTGRTVATLVDEPLAPSRYRMVFEAGELPSGVYFYRLEARDGSARGFVETRKRWGVGKSPS